MELDESKSKYERLKIKGQSRTEISRNKIIEQ
jgi:hypothetical protein